MLTDICFANFDTYFFFVKPKINLNLYIPKEHLVHLCTLMFPLTKETVTNYTEWSWTKCNWEMPERTLQMNEHILYKIGKRLFTHRSRMSSI